MTRAVGDGRKAYNLRPTIRPRPLPRTAHETPKSFQRSLRSAARQERSGKSGKRSAKLVQPGDDPLHEWPAVKILDERLVERNGKPSKEYLIQWKPGPRGEKYEPTWEPCENANGALREYYDSRTRKKAVGRPVDAERTLLTGNAVQTMRLASDKASDTNSTDHCRVVADKANAYPRRAVKEPWGTKRPGPATGATKNKRSHAGATFVSSMTSLLASPSQTAPASQILHDVGPIRARHTASRSDAFGAPTMTRGSIVESQIGRSPRPKGRLPSMLRRYGRKAL
jgi:hypothetical protein